MDLTQSLAYTRLGTCQIKSSYCRKQLPASFSCSSPSSVVHYAISIADFPHLIAPCMCVVELLEAMSLWQWSMRLDKWDPIDISYDLEDIKAMRYKISIHSRLRFFLNTCVSVETFEREISGIGFCTLQLIRFSKKIFFAMYEISL